MPMWTYPNPEEQYSGGLPRCSSNMPSSREEEPRRRRRHDSDRDRDSGSSRDKPRSSQKSSSSSNLRLRKQRSRSGERDREKDSTRPSTPGRGTPEKIPVRKPSRAVPEMERRPSGEVRPQTSYPTFSKAHSREAVGSREEFASAKPSLSPSEKSDARKENTRRRNSTPAETNGTAARAPPSPPLTADDPNISRSGSSRSMRDGTSGLKTTPAVDGKSAGTFPVNEVKTAKSGTSLRKEARFAESEISSMPGAFPEEESKSLSNSSYRRTASTASQAHSHPASTLTEDTEGTTDSDATSIAPERKVPHLAMRNTTPANATNAHGEHPIAAFQPEASHRNWSHQEPQLGRKTPSIDVAVANAPAQRAKTHSFATPTTAKHMPPPPPPPPPPPMSDPQEVPRVDYLLKNGGLSYPVPKRLVSTSPTAPVQQYSVYQSPALSQASPLEEYSKVFSFIHKRLDDYLHVLQQNGSLAVATGYKSVARRLLDKLSQVFARDIASQRCDCAVCRTTPQPILSDEEDSGVSWGEILEFVSGRRELPQWPPFTIQPDENGLGITGTTQAPMQKLDVDVPEEYRDHYIRQNQKTKRAVQSWLALQPEVPSSPPEEADEDTLMFAMMTKLTTPQRNLFIALMHGQNFISEFRAPTPAERPSSSSNALKRARKALQRLYRLERAPRDCESALYLLNNPHLHGMLATLAEVNEAEWEILTSGRFDGFLWSGAEAPFPPSASNYGASPVASRGPSRGPYPGMIPTRNTTPFSGVSGISPSRFGTPFSAGVEGAPALFPSRGPTPGPAGMGVAAPAPVQLDEDTEIAVAAELERNLFMDMERLEDAFEILHGRAELVRQMLRQRSAGLSAQAQLRRGSAFSDPIGVRLDTPASGVTDFEQEEDDDGLGDTASLAPDDSASQISVNRRRHHRRERKTPNPEPLPEEDESVFEEYEKARKERERERGGRRSKY